MGAFDQEIARKEYPAAEERNMTASSTIETPLSSRTVQDKALRLLDPWIAGDRRRLEMEMGQWREGVFALNRACDEGREELLLCLVQQMLDEPDLFAPRSEKMQLGVWIDLLMHLAHPGAEN
jgi:hypothetical protein